MIKITHMQFMGRRRAHALIRAELPLGDWHKKRCGHRPIYAIRPVINAYIDTLINDLREVRKRHASKREFQVMGFQSDDDAGLEYTWHDHDWLSPIP